MCPHTWAQEIQSKRHVQWNLWALKARARVLGASSEKAAVQSLEFLDDVTCPFSLEQSCTQHRKQGSGCGDRVQSVFTAEKSGEHSEESPAQEVRRCVLGWGRSGWPPSGEGVLWRVRGHSLEVWLVAFSSELVIVHKALHALSRTRVFCYWTSASPEACSEVQRSATLGSWDHRHTSLHPGVIGMSSFLHMFNLFIFHIYLCYILNHVHIFPWFNHHYWSQNW